MKKFFSIALCAALALALCVNAFATGDVFHLSGDLTEYSETEFYWMILENDPSVVYEPGDTVTFRIYYDVPEQSILTEQTGVSSGDVSFVINFTNFTDITPVYMWTKVCTEETCLIYTDFDRLHMNGNASATVDVQVFQGGYVIFEATVGERAVAGADFTLTYGTYSENASFVINSSLAEPLLGDANGDGVMNTGDATAILQHSVGMVLIDDELLEYADYNEDGHLNTGDAAAILATIAGLD